MIRTLEYLEASRQFRNLKAPLPLTSNTCMPSDRLNASLDIWYVQAVVASRYLTGFYRSLNDGKQAFNASQAGTRATECVSRLNLLSLIPARLAQFTSDHPEEVEAEEAAWQLLVESLAGVCAFFGIADGVGDVPAKGLSGSRTASFRDFRKALIGFRTAFPKAMLEDGVEHAITRAASTCAELTMVGIHPDVPMPDSEAVHQEILVSILDALRKEAHHVLNE